MIKEDAFGGTYFRDIYFGGNGKWYRKAWKVFDELKNINPKHYCSNYHDVSANKYDVKCGTSLRFWESNAWINEIDPNGWFKCYFRYCLGRISGDDERQIKRWEGIVTRFKGKLVEMIKDVGGKFDHHSISPNIRQVLLQWSYELVENDLL